MSAEMSAFEAAVSCLMLKLFFPEDSWVDLIKYYSDHQGVKPSEVKAFFRRENLPLFLTCDNVNVRDWVAKQILKGDDHVVQKETQSGIDTIQTPLG